MYNITDDNRNGNLIEKRLLVNFDVVNIKTK